jgi:membrane-associated HD superfamily phosphohydrolase
LIFALLGVYYKVQRRGEEDTRNIDLYGFVASKKAISLLLLVSFVGMGGYSMYQTLVGIEHPDFIHGFNTQLILTDILIILVSQCFHPSAKMMFRNSGYALSTLMIRLALVAPVYVNVLLGSAAMLFAILLTLASQHLFQERRQ